MRHDCVVVAPSLILKPPRYPVKRNWPDAVARRGYIATSQVLFWRAEVIFAIMQVADGLPDLAAWQLFDVWFRFCNPKRPIRLRFLPLCVWFSILCDV